MLADSGVFGKKFFNEVRLQARWIKTEARSVSFGQTILVPGSFNDGSAQRSGGRRQLDFELADNVDYALEKHGLRFGVQLEAGGYRSNDRTTLLALSSLPISMLSKRDCRRNSRNASAIRR